jgi:hypothetical protein
MSLRKLLRRRLDKAESPRSYRPYVEVLENRNLLSVCTVDRLTDNNPSGGGEGSNGMGDLRWCMSGTADTVNFAVTGSISLSGVLPKIARNVHIDGPGPTLLTVLRRTDSGDYGIFTVAERVTASISGLTISNGLAHPFGGGIFNGGTLTVSNCTISGNSAVSYSAGGGGIYNGWTLTIIDSTIVGNSASSGNGTGSGSGGGILNGGTLTITNSTISGNSASGIGFAEAASGGGIDDGGPQTTISNSTISGNSVAGPSYSYGGGIYREQGTLAVSDSTIADNSATSTSTGNAYGGGLYVVPYATVTIRTSTISGNSAAGVASSSSGVGGGIYGGATVTNSTISGNSATGSDSGGFGIGGFGGGICVIYGETLTISDSTITLNSAAGSYFHNGSSNGGGILNQGGTTTTRNTIIAGNTVAQGPGPDVYGNMGSQGYNILGDTWGASGWTNTDLLRVDPLLGPLQNNGGPTQTMALQAGSPALGTGDPAQVNSPDQRGVPRTGGVDIGAYQASATTFLVAGFPSPVTAGTGGSITVTARDPYGNTALGYRGTVHFTSSDPQATLPADNAFLAADNGVHTFNVTLKTAGIQALTATDTADGSLTGDQSGIVVNAADAVTLDVRGPDSATADTPFDITVTARDPFGNVAIDYRGTVTFTSSDSLATLPADYSYTAADGGVHTFCVTLRTVGLHIITATDTSTGSITGTAIVEVTAMHFYPPLRFPLGNVMFDVEKLYSLVGAMSGKPNWCR